MYVYRVRVHLLMYINDYMIGI